MNDTDHLKQLLRKDCYRQAGSAWPFVIGPAAASGFMMKSVVGYGYSQFVFSFRGQYCEMRYPWDDLKLIWQNVLKNQTNDPHYLATIQGQYEALFVRHEPLFAELDQHNLTSLEDDELLTYLRRASEAMVDAVGIAHMVEGISINAEQAFHEALTEEIPDLHIRNHYFPLLSSPTKLSFTAEEERSLYALRALSGVELEKALTKHLARWNWVQNSYAGAPVVTLEALQKRLEEMPDQQQSSMVTKADKQEVIDELDLSAATRRLIHIIDFVTIWQDERKANSLRTIAYIIRMLEQVSKRTGISLQSLAYLGYSEVEHLARLSDLIPRKAELDLRTEGCYYILEPNNESFVSGSEYQALRTYEDSLHTTEGITELKGSIACKGKVVGPVALCRDVSELGQVKDGDVLVASMTRPEYMPAIRKAVAIVTDEGGITCHAAIVARELNIPCIIGTKHATRVLKNGQIVEVDANSGVVRKI